ncbi:hypothetical protein [Streptomyces sp. MZ04]|uniref:hypothetical protein n=1 Tax=Streptomyces sp. MZ04 TaxID=2559236 RepID=UPI00107EDE57|nr:hypothetical protein [Streptomyces sp. MZ04]TGB05765.1 hypothetical protein E2651_24315 [Streptomyces sp. MZ04]
MTFSEAPAEDEVIQVPGDGLALTSSDNDFYPLVRIEAWDGEPPLPAEAWDHQREFHATLTDELGVLDLNGVTYGRAPVTPGPAHVRLLCRGREHTPALESLDEFPPVSPHEDPLEIWLIQVWPDR